MPFGPYMMPLAAWEQTLIPALAIFLIFGGGGLVRYVVESVNRTRVELAQLRSQHTADHAAGSDINSLRAEIDALREQVSELRDTTTQYDLSFDTALQRMERRVEHVEQQTRLTH